MLHILNNLFQGANLVFLYIQTTTYTRLFIIPQQTKRCKTLTDAHNDVVHIISLIYSITGSNEETLWQRQSCYTMNKHNMSWT